MNLLPHWYSMIGQTSHRPWPPPTRPWLMVMCWHDLLFAHWPVAAGPLRALLPEGLQLDLFEGQAWLGVVPFGMRGVRPRGLPAVPHLSAFPEINLRTYVTRDGKPGVWFFSLDAARWLAVRLARRIHLPYFDAQMKLASSNDGWIEYRSRRVHRYAAHAEFHGRYRPTGPAYQSRDGQLDHWLTHRYALYTADQRGRLARLEVHHPPWSLQPAEVELSINRMSEQIGIELPPVPELVHFSASLDVVAWWPERV
jgi:uncharacterized protein YqjF (DUF2071 family)